MDLSKSEVEILLGALTQAETCANALAEIMQSKHDIPMRDRFRKQVAEIEALSERLEEAERAEL